MLEIIQNNWNAIKKVVKDKGSLSDISYRTWVEPLALENLTNGVLVICFPCNVDTAVWIIMNDTSWIPPFGKTVYATCN